ncbi:DUF1775 domain-containing protein [Streptomyces sp. WI04-05B]|uniref:DUF1775 domain-containing protein n=1 Tax=Streptomyces TaxID=1883 RepID=UPI0029A7FF02|nr:MULTISPECIES: DUF1775 domain-containing protein [unclassified Streptomyces]MDX2548522.1 DUF1775 domain-containing protein [Streptomyces sp. WI04-05B]MDX2582618.1 DUF1775 domain-containing protein [Streptomyces sp. WI04-05A]MDX3747067.1 DUF1775 domain-containing protein [Streptomyces sp. AK08-02]
MFTAPVQHGTARRLALTAAAAGALLLLTAVPAAAHVEVESDKAQALAENVEISFDAEAESDTAGIAAVRVILPAGIAPGDVTYGEGPKGWKFSAADDGYTIKGPALKAGVNAEYSVVVRQLPDVKELAFKSLQTYSDGKIDRWIELDESSEQPAPVLKLKAAAPGAKPVSPSPSATASESPSASPSAPASESPSVTSTSTAEATEATSDDDGMSAGAWIGIGAAVVVAAGSAFYVVRRRGATQE